MSLLARSRASTADRQPSRTYYQVLDVSPEEHDPKVIEEAAFRCHSRVRIYQLTREAECIVRMNEIAQALNTLLDPIRRREYDLSLAKPPSPTVPERRPAGERDTRVLRQAKSAPPAPRKEARVPPFRDGERCDVKLVYRRRAQ
jgi:hypothetical protein